MGMVYVFLWRPRFVLMHGHDHAGVLSRHIIWQLVRDFTTIASHSPVDPFSHLQDPLPQPETRHLYQRSTTWVLCHHFAVGYGVSQSSKYRVHLLSWNLPTAASTLTKYSALPLAVQKVLKFSKPPTVPLFLPIFFFTVLSICRIDIARVHVAPVPCIDF